MAQKPETIFKNRIRPHLNALPNSWWVKIQQVALRGIPDFLGCINGQFIALELKKDPKAPIGKMQIYILSQIEKVGGYCRVLYPENWEVIFEELKKMSQASRNSLTAQDLLDG
jgi:hypothetical protein